MSNFFVPGRKSAFHDVYIHTGLRPRPFATAVARSTSYPRGFVTVLPRTVPDAKPTAGSPKATISLPGWSVGAAVRFAVAAGAATRAANSRAGRRRFTVPSSELQESRIYRGPPALSTASPKGHDFPTFP